MICANKAKELALASDAEDRKVDGDSGVSQGLPHPHLYWCFGVNLTEEEEILFHKVSAKLRTYGLEISW